jgi:integrase/recombinase XerD
MTPPILVGPLLQIFFTEYLVAQKRLSLQTIASYRDTFRLLLQFVHRETGIQPVALPIDRLDADRVLAFLDGLEKDRHNTIGSRNLRLTAIRSFFRMVALREPAMVGLAARIVAIPMKRTDSKERDYVTREEMDAVLASLDRTHWCGRRDYALLLTMYNAGARVSEIACLRQQHVTFGPTCYVQLHGKGRKERSIPLWPKTAQILQEWFREIGARDDEMAFPNIRRAPLTRFAIHLLLRNAAGCLHPLPQPRQQTRVTARDSTRDRDGPIAGRCRHCRHCCVARARKHRDHQRVRANLAMKEKALAKIQPMDTPFRRFRPDDRLLAFLESL